MTNVLSKDCFYDFLHGKVQFEFKIMLWRVGGPLKGSRREKSLLAIKIGTPRNGPLGGKPNPLEVAVPVQIFT